MHVESTSMLLNIRSSHLSPVLGRYTQYGYKWDAAK